MTDTTHTEASAMDDCDEALEDEAREYRLAQSAHNRESCVPFPSNGLVPRYFKGLDCPDDYTADVVYIDRLTGREVMRYDGADPANTNPYYGATTDSECFRRKGLNIGEMIDPGRAVISLDECRDRMRESDGWD